MKRQNRTYGASRYIVLVATFIGLCLVGMFAHFQWYRGTEEHANADRALTGASTLLAEHMARTLELAENALHAAEDIRKAAVADNYDDAKIHDLLTAVHGGSPIFRSIAWIDGQGNRVASSSGANLPPLNIAYAPHFVEMRDDPNLGKRLYIGPPLFSKYFDAWIFILALRIETPDGKFDGMMAGVANLDYFSKVYQSAGLGETGIVQLLRPDGLVLIREPFDKDLHNLSWADRRADATALADPLSQAFHLQGLSMGASRLIRIASVSDGAAYLSISKTTSEVYAGFWHIFIEDALLLALMLCVLGFGARTITRHLHRQEQLEGDLTISHGRFEDFAAAAGDWFWESDSEHRITWMSDSVERSIGRKPEWFYDQTALNTAGDNMSPEELVDRWSLLNEHKLFRDYEFLRGGPTGDLWISASGVPKFDKTGKFTGYRGSARDITNLRRAELRLREAIDAIPGRFLMFDSNQRLAFFNNATEAPVAAMNRHLEIGLTFEEIMRRMIADGLLLDAVDDPEAYITERMKYYHSGEGCILTQFEDCVVEVFERPTHDGGVISLRFDVTARERALATQRLALETAAAANQAKSEFLARMSHELRTPLNAIIGFGQILQINQPGTLTEDQKEYADHIVKSGLHLLELVKEVLDLSAIEAGHLKLTIENVQLSNVLTHAVATMRPVADQARVRLNPVGDLSMLSVRVDLQRLRQVLLNLLSNAIKYNRPGGSVVISAEENGEFIRISVQDTGIGIAPEHRGKVYTPFDRLGAENSGEEGAGIGLTLCKQLLEAMDGHIDFISEPGVGTTFTVDLPRDKDAPRASNGSAAAMRGATGTSTAANGYSLLYIEDSPASLRLMEHLVATMSDVTMYSAPSAALGLQLAASRLPDIIILDLNLPGMGGLEILSRLKADPKTWSIPVIALTAAAMPNDIQRGLTAGFYRYITKPLDVNAFLKAINDALTVHPAPPETPNTRAFEDTLDKHIDAS